MPHYFLTYRGTGRLKLSSLFLICVPSLKSAAIAENEHESGVSKRISQNVELLLLVYYTALQKLLLCRKEANVLKHSLAPWTVTSQSNIITSYFIHQ